ncbi:MAG: ornithine cyclodeaminase family protein, partial [Eubacteriales bacterium]|nr:ornithine cyclodeaminase family protein [Eubacteriales bacterium]
MGVLILNREEVKRVIDMREVIDKVRNVYQLKTQGKSVIWPLVNHEFVDEHAAMDIRSGYIKGEQLHGLKMLNNFPDNKEKGLPPFNGIMMVYDSNTGIPVGIMDASYITCVRTGAAGALGVDSLARKDAKTLMLLGAGKQSSFQIAATLILRPMIDTVYIVDPVNHQQAKDLAAAIKEQLKTDFDVNGDYVTFIAEESTETAVRNSDAIITITPSRKPIIMKEWVRPGTHFSCIGSDMETKQEIESAIFAGARIFADDIDQCIRVGEMEIPLLQGVINKEDIAGEIGDLLSGNVPGRQSDQETTIFDATGLYILD